MYFKIITPKGILNYKVNELHPLFLLVAINQNSAWNENFWTTLKGDHQRIIPVKFGEIPPRGLGDVFLKQIVDRQQMDWPTGELKTDGKARGF